MFVECGEINCCRPFFAVVSSRDALCFFSIKSPMSTAKIAKLVPKISAKIITKLDPNAAPVKANCAVFGSGLSKSGALACRHLVMEPSGAAAVLRPLRLGRLNEKKIRKVAAGFGFSLFAASDALYGSGLNNFYQLGGPERPKNAE